MITAERMHELRRTAKERNCMVPVGLVAELVDEIDRLTPNNYWREIALAMAQHIGHNGYEALRESGHWSKYQNLLSAEQSMQIQPISK